MVMWRIEPRLRYCGRGRWIYEVRMTIGRLLDDDEKTCGDYYVIKASIVEGWLRALDRLVEAQDELERLYAENLRLKWLCKQLIEMLRYYRKDANEAIRHLDEENVRDIRKMPISLIRKLAKEAGVP